MLKEASVDANKLWKAAGKPNRDTARFTIRARQVGEDYRKLLRDKQTSETESYTNDLHDALLKKNGNVFWKCWRSKSEQRKKCTEVVSTLTLLPKNLPIIFRKHTLAIITVKPIT